MIRSLSLRKAFQLCTPLRFRSLSNPTALQIPSDDSPDLFRYTSGRWIYNEHLRLRERILHFNVTELKKAAAAAVNRDAATVQSFRKLAEGGFNRVFELVIDGLHIIARLSYPATYPKHYSVASEVATMALVRTYGIPAPRILDYSASSDNAVGAEYIIMEKVRGRDLGDIWYELSEKERLKVVVETARLESVLFSIPLPAYGSTYYKNDLESGTEGVDIAPGEKSVEAAGEALGDEMGRHGGQLCVGPDVAQKWWFEKRAQLKVPRGPFLDADQAFTAGATKELVWLKKYAQPRLPFVIPHREIYDYQNVSPSDHITSIEKYLQIAPHLVPRDAEYLLQPTLRHSDFQPRNIFVADDFTITGVIDWQHCSILPLILQSGVPEYFQNFGDDESLRLKKPFLPESFSSMSETEQAEASEQYRRRHLHYYYFVATYKYNQQHYDALFLDWTMPKQKLQQYASTPWEGDSISLKAELIRAVENWPMLTASKSGHIPTCPIHFSDEEIEECLRMEAEQNHLDVQMEKIRDRIGLGIDGWTPHERYEDACEENEHVKVEALHGEDDATRKELLDNWPFDDHEEF